MQTFLTLPEKWTERGGTGQEGWNGTDERNVMGRRGTGGEGWNGTGQREERGRE